MSLLAELVALLAPPGCLACGRALAGAHERMCAACVRALPWLRAGCVRCGLPSHGGRRCPAAHAAFPRAWAPMAYEGVARQLVAALKFRAALVAADVMAAHIAANLPAPLRGVDAALVPVPPARLRRRVRGFDPTLVLARAVSARTGWPLVEALAREDRAPRQARANRRARRAPGRIDIRVRGSPPARALVLDDVHTTGATLNACARALASQGGTVVAALTYARTL
jgi:predicted amidophosphoribosyltransferase